MKPSGDKLFVMIFSKNSLSVIGERFLIVLVSDVFIIIVIIPDRESAILRNFVPFLNENVLMTKIM